MKVERNLLDLLSGKKYQVEAKNEEISDLSESQTEITQEKEKSSKQSLSPVKFFYRIKKLLVLCFYHVLELEKAFKERIMREKIKDFLKKNIKIELTLVSCFIFFGGILSLIYFDYKNNLGLFFEKRFVILAQTRDSLNKYSTIKPDELHNIWFNTLKNFDKTHTNVQALATVVNKLGAQIDEKDDSLTFVKKINAYAEVGLCSTTSVPKTGSLIIFRGTWAGKIKSHRIGIIEEVCGSYIKFMEWSPELGTTFPVIRKNDYTIQMIVEFSYPIWSGILLKNGIRITRGISLFHRGVDMKLSNFDRRVYAFEGGTVVKVFNNYNPKKRWSDWINSGGNYVVIKSRMQGKDCLMRYLHLYNLKVKVGQKIGKNQLLGQYDDIGYSFGAHLHLDVHDMQGKLMDPLPDLSDYASFIIYSYDDERSYIASNMLLDSVN